MITIAPSLIYLSRADWGADPAHPRLGYAVAPAARTEAIVHHTVIVDSDATKNVWETLDEVKAARPTFDFDPRYGTDDSWTPAMFVEAVYRNLTAAPAAAGRAR